MPTPPFQFHFFTFLTLYLSPTFSSTLIKASLVLINPGVFADFDALAHRVTVRILKDFDQPLSRLSSILSRIGQRPNNLPNLLQYLATACPSHIHPSRLVALPIQFVPRFELLQELLPVPHRSLRFRDFSRLYLRKWSSYPLPLQKVILCQMHG